MTTTGTSVRQRLRTPVDAAGLAALRIAFGALLCFAVARFVARGWVAELLLEPASHFTYLGFEWVRPWAPWAMYAHFALMGVLALALMVGFCARSAALASCVLFTYAELIEKASYLNHYYFISLLSFLFSVVPSSGTWSVDAWRGRVRSASVPRWAYWLLRAQVALVYFYAGAAKLNADWLLRAEPLSTWLQVHADLPLLGPTLAAPWCAYVLSWAGAAYDLSIVALLLFRRTRPWAFAAVVGFHVATWLLFPIGVFPWVMIVASTIFFEPSWPRTLLRRLGAPASTPALVTEPRPLPRLGYALLVVHLALQVLLPLRFLLYPGDVNWTEQGFRFAWRVMLIEKTGQVDYEVITANPEGRQRVYPRRELTPLQYKMMSTQPDMIHEYALRIAQRFRAQGASNVRVHANAWASLNGRPSQRLIDPSVDLAAVPRSLLPQPFIVPLSPSRELAQAGGL
jgi:vitamin K-dependent gamma-carboxylase